MNPMNATTVNSANAALAQGCESSRTLVRSKLLTTEVMQKAHDLWKLNVRLHLSDFAKVHPRTIDYWEAGDRQISTEAFLTLLDSKAGLEFLEIFMRQIRPDLRQQWLDQQALLAKLDRSESKRKRLERQSQQLRLELKR